MSFLWIDKDSLSLILDLLFLADAFRLRRVSKFFLESITLEEIKARWRHYIFDQYGGVPFSFFWYDDRVMLHHLAKRKAIINFQDDLGKSSPRYGTRYNEQNNCLTKNASRETIVILNGCELFIEGTVVWCRDHDMRFKIFRGLLRDCYRAKFVYLSIEICIFSDGGKLYYAFPESEQPSRLLSLWENISLSGALYHKVKILVINNRLHMVACVRQFNQDKTQRWGPNIEHNFISLNRKNKTASMRFISMIESSKRSFVIRCGILITMNHLKIVRYDLESMITSFTSFSVNPEEYKKVWIENRPNELIAFALSRRKGYFSYWGTKFPDPSFLQ